TVSAGRNKSDAEVFRFLETGVLDSSFSSPKFTFGGNSQTEPQAIALQSNGQIVVGGITNAHGTRVTGGLARLDSNGQLDTTFASGGLVSQEAVSGLLIQTDGKIVAIGNNGNLVSRPI
ncbi:MAG TPA: delta-60 repeat domain-containing protein, partial [Candidatus Acidoferrum sp.]|nr:delta-60 repeat domain-containing protein [Candidatus Acidoferrum sp.]